MGIDLVAMSVNDLLVMGAEPLFFLDYFATGSIEAATVSAVISGIVRGCKLAGCSLICGETAEMPDFYARGEYDLAGFCVGMVDHPDVVDGSKIKPGDAVLGIASSGLHSNGFSLVRKVLLERKRYRLETIFAELGKPLGEVLLTPTVIYVKPVLQLCRTVPVSGMAHITGGGFVGNIPRVLPSDSAVAIAKGSWPIPPIFDLIQRDASLDDFEMFRTFNMGVGFVVIVSRERTEAALENLGSNGMSAWVIGEVVPRPDTGEAVVFR